ncbi:MAG: HEAT repeat domain-containing protein, partial [Planctomycetota bacterium]
MGERRDEQAVPELARLTGSGDTAVASAAIRALGRIGGNEAARALARARVAREFRDLKADALLSCADALLRAGETEKAAAIYGDMTGRSNPPMVRVAAYRGLLLAAEDGAVPVVLELLTSRNRVLRQAAMKFVSELPGTAMTEALAAELPSLDGETQLQLLAALEVRGDKAAAPALAKIAQSPDSAISVPAVRALGVLGGPAEVELLARLAAAGGERGTAARESLDRLSGDDVKAALMVVADSEDPGVRRVVLKALGDRAGQEDYPDIVAMLVTTKNALDRRYLQRALMAAAARVEDPDA